MPASDEKQNDKSKSKQVAQPNLHSFFIPRKKSKPDYEQVRTRLVAASEIRPGLNQSLNIPVEDISTKLNETVSTLQNNVDTESETPSCSNQYIYKHKTPRAILPDIAEGACQPHSSKYPATKFGKKDRCFSSKWYKGRSWLSYDIKLDACFCAICVLFSHNTGNKGPFITPGYKDWKHALDTSKEIQEYKKGFAQHGSSREKVNRETKNKKIATLVIKPIADHIVWLDTMFTVVKYLGINGLPFRGHIEKSDFLTEDFGGGLYLNTYAAFVFKLKPELHEIAKRLPSNAKYTSPDVQNEVAEILSEMVKETIAIRVRGGKLYTIMMDGSTNKNGEEVIGLVVRYIHKSVICENVLNIATVQDRSAKELLSFFAATFEKYKVDKGGAVSQAYDGAPVMAGEFNGIKAQFSAYCDRPVIYIHYYCHRLHLIVIAVLESIPDIGDHLAIVSSLYNFFSLYKVKKMYTGTSLHKLITTRWSGHYFAINAIEGNLKEIIAVLKKSSTSQQLDSSQRVTSSGLKHRVDDPKFMYINTMINEALGLTDIGNKTLQSRKKTLQ